MKSLIPEMVALGLAAAFTGVGAVVTIVVLMSMPYGLRRGISFLGGRLLAIALIGLLVAFVLSGLDFSSRHTSPSRAASAIEVLLGTLLLIAAARGYRQPRRDRAPQSAPAWLSRIEGTHWLLSVMVGVVMLSYTVTLAAAAEILKSNVDGVDASVAALVFTVFSAIAVAAPVAVAIAMPDRSFELLASWKAWLLANSRIVVLVALTLVGLFLVVRGAYDLAA